MNIPDRLHPITIISLFIVSLSALLIVVDILSGNKQHMWIMNIVWPLTALYVGPLAGVVYFNVGRLSTH